MTVDSHWLDSSLREKLIEHLFVGDLLRFLWCSGRRDIEVLRAEVDRGGYDLALECRGVLRHVQLKASFRGATAKKVNVNVALARKPAGCVIWIHFDPATMALGPYLWFGGACGEGLPDLGEKLARQPRANSTGQKAQRPGLRELARTRFKRMDAIEEVAHALFGT
jgi:hypothetical protein